MSISGITGSITSAVKKIKPLSVVTKGAGALALLSVLNESNEIGIKKSSQDIKDYKARKMVRLGIGTGKLNYESPKYNKIKNYIYNNPIFMGKAWHGFKGYMRGFTEGIAHNIFTVGFAAFAVAAKGTKTKIAALIGLLGSIGLNFVINGTNAFEKTDELEH